jgi:DnaJ-domain-containing protein 1
MFLKATNLPPIGTTVRIDLELPSASVIVLTGVIQQHVTDPARGVGVELKLAPIPTGSIWLIESALASSDSTNKRAPTGAFPATSVTGPVATLSEGEDVAAAEQELIRSLMLETESLKKLNPFLVLGVGYEATDSDVRAAFGELTKRYHPDRFARYQSTELRQTAAEIFILIRDAYRKLGDEPTRNQVLISLGRQPRAGSNPRPPAAGHPPVRKTPAVGIPVIRPPSANPLPAIPPVARPEPPRDPKRTQQIGRTDDRSVSQPISVDAGEAGVLEEMLDAGRYDEALTAYKAAVKKFPQDRPLRAGVELCEGMRALAQRDRLEAAQRFEAALEIDPSNERAARELADMRRQATNERKGLLSRLMGKKEPPT